MASYDLILKSLVDFYQETEVDYTMNIECNNRFIETAFHPFHLSVKRLINFSSLASFGFIVISHSKLRIDLLRISQNSVTYKLIFLTCSSFLCFNLFNCFVRLWTLELKIKISPKPIFAINFRIITTFSFSYHYTVVCVSRFE